MRYSISDTAEYGDLTRGPRVINEDVRDEMRELLAEIQTGEFAREWILENQAGRPVYNALKRAGQGAPHREGGQGAPRHDELDRRRGRARHRRLRATTPGTTTGAGGGEPMALPRRPRSARVAAQAAFCMYLDCSVVTARTLPSLSLNHAD